MYSRINSSMHADIASKQSCIKVRLITSQQQSSADARPKDSVDIKIQRIQSSLSALNKWLEARRPHQQHTGSKGAAMRVVNDFVAAIKCNYDHRRARLQDCTCMVGFYEGKYNRKNKRLMIFLCSR